LKISIVFLISLDEDDDLSEGDVSADPIEGRCHICLSRSIISLLFYFPGTSKGEKRKRDVDHQQDNDDDDDDVGPPQKL